MVLWGVLVGALVGWLLGDFGTDGVWPGAMVGALVGFVLRRAIRREVARGREALRAELITLIEGRQVEGRQVDHPAASPMAGAVSVPMVPASVPGPGSSSPIAMEATATAPSSSVPPSRPQPVPPESASSGSGDVFATPATRPRPDQVPDTPPSPRGPNAVERLFAAGIGWLLGGNTIVRVGLVILFVGLSFLASYAANAGLFPIELRLALVAAAGIALLGVGFSRREQKPEFALTMQGGGVAILYLTLFAASTLFGAIPAVAAFPLMIAVCALGCALALLQDSQALAGTSFAGGFAVPILLAGEGAGGIGLFAYYTVLNLAVLAIAWRRSWRMVNLIGFVATFGLATLWGVLVYDPALYGLSQFFLILFVLIYVAAGILHARNTPGRMGNVVDGTLLFGPALAGFGLQAGLVRHLPLGSAFSALGFGALYLGLALFVMKRGRGDNRVLGDGLVAVAVGFVTLAVPLALGVRWTAPVWALEGAGAFWLGARQARWLPRAFGLALQAAGGLVFLASLRDNVSALPLLNPNTLGAVLLALPALGIAWWLRGPLEDSGSKWAKGYAEVERALPQPMFVYAFALWCLACILETARMLPPRIVGGALVSVVPQNLTGPVLMLAFVASAAMSAWVGRRLAWGVATWPGRVTLAALVLALLGRSGPDSFILVWPNWPFWLVATALHYRLLYLNDRATPPGDPLFGLQRVVHVGGVWLLAAMLTDCLWMAIDRAGLWHTSWAGVTFLVGAIVALLALTLWPARGGARWPLATHRDDYRWFATVPVAVLLFVGAAGTALFAEGRTDPLPYVPLLNPVDLSLALAIAALALWHRTIAAARPRPLGARLLDGPPPLIALAALGFVVVNTVWLRIAHHLLGVGWSGPALMGSFVVQTGLSILWTLLALGLTLAAHRRGQRGMWLAGAGLLGVVVAKLLLVDLSNADGAARIVTFIVVGILMLVVGYFAPLPPKAADAPAGEKRA